MGGVVKIIVTVMFGWIIAFPAVAVEISDPMRPPPFALQKFRLEKLKDQPPVNRPKADKSQAKVWELNSILYSQNRQHAIINNQVVKKGGTIDGAKLVRIRRDGVRLIARGKVINLSLPAKQSVIKKSLNENKL